VEFEPTNPVFERAKKVQALEHAVTVIDLSTDYTALYIFTLILN
jgi:hypothetical protein